MDKYEKMFEMMSKASEEERKKSMMQKRAMCTCGGCPSYNDCAKDGKELLFCATGKSPSCITEEKGCICPKCPVTPEMGLIKTYFCTKGSEAQQRGLM